MDPCTGGGGGRDELEIDMFMCTAMCKQITDGDVLGDIAGSSAHCSVIVRWIG